MKNIIGMLTSEKIVRFLVKTPFFCDFPTPVLLDIAAELEVTSLAGGEKLFNQNDVADSLYIVMYGYLKVVNNEQKNKAQVIGHISVGNVVGEIGCLINEPRMASIYAVRDSVLLKMTRETFDHYLEKYPGPMMSIARQCVKRLVHSRVAKSRVSCFALIPAADCKQIMAFSHAFVGNLSQYGSTLLITQESFEELFGMGAAQTSLDGDKNTEIISRLHELESEHHYIVYVADKADEWARRCIRQVDKVLLVGQEDDFSFQLGPVERYLESQIKKQGADAELVLVSKKTINSFRDTRKWYAHRQINQHYHVRLSVAADIKWFTRLITGHSLGLVLSGGGAPALAHIGLIRALETLKIPIDYIGGTSMGGIIGGLVALGHNSETLTSILASALTEFKKKIDYTLPISGIFKGKYLGHLLRNAFGEDTLIENLQQKFFCISTNITKNEVVVHEKGLLWEAIRASVSLPAIFPPTHNEYNQLIVDGSILNNLPVDIMQGRINGGKILASSLKKHPGYSPNSFLEEDTSSGWYLFLKYFLLPKLWRDQLLSKKVFPSIAGVIHDSMITGSYQHQQMMIAQADYNIVIDAGNISLLNFKLIHQIVDLGYKQAMEELQKFVF